MRLLSLDPSMSCTGWAVLEGEPGTDGAVIEAGVIKPDGDERMGIRRALYTEARQLMMRACGVGSCIAVETPAERRTAWGGFRNRGAMDGPQYGAAVGVVLGAAWSVQDSPAVVSVIGVPVDTWAAGIPKGKRVNRAGVLVPDDNKGQRVAMVKYVYGLDIGGSKADAGGVADAILMARWVLMNRMREVKA